MNDENKSKAQLIAELQSLRYREENLKRSQQVAKIGSWEWCFKDEVLTWSDEIYRQYGLKPGEIEPSLEAFEQYVHPDDRTLLRDSINKALTDNQPYSLELKMLRDDGSEWMIHEQGVIERDDDGNPTRFIGTQQDITEYKKTELEMRLHSTLLEQTMDGIAIADMEGYIQYVNAAWAAMHGYDIHELLGKHLSIFHTPEQMQQDVIPFNTILKERGIHSGHVGHIKKNGEIFQTQMSNCILSDERGVPIGMAGIARDKTQEQALEAQLRQIQKMDSLNTFAGGIAHNLRNVLATIMGWIEIASDNSTDHSILSTALARATNAGERASEQIRELLTFSHTTDTNKKTIHLESIITEELHLLENIVPATVTFRIRIDEHIGVILGDAAQLQQVIHNIVANAVQAMDAGGVLEVSLEQVTVKHEEAEPKAGLKDGVYAQLCVSDTGSGMSEDTLNRIYEPFFTTKEPGKGTGLGLSIVYGILKNHDAIIDVDSEVGKGTSVSIFFPIKAGTTEDFTTEEYVKEDAVAAKGIRLLLIDDDVDFLEMTGIGLQSLGYSVESHSNAVKALESFSATPEKFDLVITDQIMPTMTGMELVHHIHGIRNDMVSILVSGIVEMVDTTDAEKVGIHQQLAKPVTPRDLDRTVKSVLALTQPEDN